MIKLSASLGKEKLIHRLNPYGIRVADDNRDATDNLTLLLEHWGHEAWGL